MDGVRALFGRLVLPLLLLTRDWRGLGLYDRLGYGFVSLVGDGEIYCIGLAAAEILLQDIVRFAIIVQ